MSKYILSEVIINETLSPEDALGCYYSAPNWGALEFNVQAIEKAARDYCIPAKDVALWTIHHECWHVIQHRRGNFERLEPSDEALAAWIQWGRGNGLKTLTGRRPYALKNELEFEAELFTQMSIGWENFPFDTILWKEEGFHKPIIISKDWNYERKRHKALVAMIWPSMWSCLYDRSFRTYI